ncbi:hypothetical protein BU14_0208s0035 [Porphyra umbilicalis]|uniref:Uncharacterized protein n=1 Tax=Porphyra umbilicalis TaxID=2786 RepID=A0A1X6P5G5_PORUM|nr:hypothetical protein BU14_0208s0035 [Porphyra umbilicalis]|eukprot:OSX76078.1 hypothetical protein BU14_0208s0035 [Porphyra umbilicalis]
MPVVLHTIRMRKLCLRLGVARLSHRPFERPVSGAAGACCGGLHRNNARTAATLLTKDESRPRLVVGVTAVREGGRRNLHALHSQA